MKQLKYIRELIETISKSFVSSWAYFITRVCESILGLTPIIKESDHDKALPQENKSRLQTIAGISDEIQANIFNLFPDKTYAWCIYHVRTFSGSSESSNLLLQMISKTVVDSSDPTLGKVLTAICDYLLIQHLKSTKTKCEEQLDFGEYIEDLVAISDAKAWKTILLDSNSDSEVESEIEETEGEAEEEEEEETEEVDDESEIDENDGSTADDRPIEKDTLLQMLQGRYRGVSWYHVLQGLEDYDELLELWEHMDLNTSMPSQNDILEHGLHGLAIVEHLCIKETRLTYEQCRYIAMQLPAITFEANYATELAGDELPMALLEVIREDGEEVTISIDMPTGYGAQLFQLLAALLYQHFHTEIVCEVNYYGYRSKSDSYAYMSLLKDLFDKAFSLTKCDEEDSEPLIELFGNDMFYRTGNPKLLQLVCEGDSRKLARLSFTQEEIDSSYVSALDLMGLYDNTFGPLGDVSAISSSCHALCDALSLSLYLSIYLSPSLSLSLSLFSLSLSLSHVSFSPYFSSSLFISPHVNLI
jgi:hypothetical protein